MSDCFEERRLGSRIVRTYGPSRTGLQKAALPLWRKLNHDAVFNISDREIVGHQSALVMLPFGQDVLTEKLRCVAYVKKSQESWRNIDLRRKSAYCRRRHIPGE